MKKLLTYVIYCMTFTFPKKGGAVVFNCQYINYITL